MSNEEFDNLKEELMREGNDMVMLSASLMSDAEFDKLKLRLKQDGSDIVTEGPRSSLCSRKLNDDKNSCNRDVITFPLCYLLYLFKFICSHGGAVDGRFLRAAV